MEPTSSMYGRFTYIWLIFMVNVGKYAMGNGVDVSEGSFSIDILFKQKEESTT